MSSIIHKTNAVMTSKVSRTTFRKLIFNLLKYSFSLIIFKWFLQKQALGGVLLKKVVVRSFAKFTGNRPWPATLLKKRLWHRCFPVNFEKLLKIPCLQNTSGGCFCFQRQHPSYIMNNKNQEKRIFPSSFSIKLLA